MRGRRVPGAAPMVFLAHRQRLWRAGTDRGPGLPPGVGRPVQLRQPGRVGGRVGAQRPFTALPGRAVDHVPQRRRRPVRATAHRCVPQLGVELHLTAGARRAVPSPTTPPWAWEGGYFEARIRYSPNQWAWPSFWLFSEGQDRELAQRRARRRHRSTASSTSSTAGGSTPRPGRVTTTTAPSTATPPPTARGAGRRPAVHLRRVAPGRHGPDPVARVVGPVDPAMDGTGQAHLHVDGIEIGCNPTFDTTNQPMVLNFTIQGNGQQVCTGCVPWPARRTSTWTSTGCAMQL